VFAESATDIRMKVNNGRWKMRGTV
jgi:hypothetical protein